MSAISLALLVSYGSVWSAGWVYEDRQWRDLAAADSWWRPLSVWTWQLADTPVMAHALNLALHLVVAVLTGYLAGALGASVVASWAATAWLALHPLAVESVAYATGRAELLAAIGVLGACLAAIRGSWIGVACGLACGLAAKQSAIVGVLLVPLVLRSWRLGVAAVCLLGGLAVAVGWSDLVNLGESNAATVTAASWALSQATAAFRLVMLTIVPIGQTVDFDVDVLAPWVAWVSVGGLLGVTALAVSQRRSLVGIGLAWTLIAILPRLIVQTPKSYLNEHQWFTPLIGLVIAGAAWVGGVRRCA